MTRPIPPTLTALSYFYLMTQALSSCDSINLLTLVKLSSQSPFYPGMLLITFGVLTPPVWVNSTEISS